MKILIVEDEEALANGLRFNFEQEGYQVEIAGDGFTALERFRAADGTVDLVVLDLMLPGMSGYETCREIRKIDPRVPILVLSARTLAEDKTLAFDSGTDQYMTKPFALPELLSRIRNLLQRHSLRRSDVAADRFEFDNTCIDFTKYELTASGQTHNLTKMEVDLLRYFIEHEGRVLTRAELLENVWKESAQITSRSIDNFVLRLRKLIEPDPSVPRHFLSVRGAGYRFVADSDDATSSAG